MNVKDYMTDERVDRMRSAFDEFDDNSSGDIDVPSLQRALRSYGVNPTESDMSVINNELSRTTTVDFNTFAYYCYHLDRSTNTEKELLRAFSVFDRDGTGKVKLDYVYTILGNLVRPMQPAQIDRVVKDIEVDNGFIEISVLVKALLND